MVFQETDFQALETHGWCVSDDVLTPSMLSDLRSLCQEQWRCGKFHTAHIGRQATQAQNADLRGDSICWIDGRAPLQESAGFFDWADKVRTQLNERYFLSLKRGEFHFARYPVGSRYVRHIDQHRGSGSRKISLVVYLNDDWHPDDGGALCLYKEAGDVTPAQSILPVGGRIALFRSDSIEHEVRPAFRTRWSLTGWFRDDEE